MTNCITGDDWWECNHQPDLKNYYIVAVDSTETLLFQVELLNELGEPEQIKNLPLNWIPA